MPYTIAPSATIGTPRPMSWNSALPTSAEYHHSWKSAGRYRSLTMSPVLMRSVISSPSPKNPTNAMRA